MGTFATPSLRKRCASSMRDGPEAVSLRELATAAGVSAAAPYQHFADRSAVLAGVALKGYQDMNEQLRKFSSARSSRKNLRSALASRGPNCLPCHRRDPDRRRGRDISSVLFEGVIDPAAAALSRLPAARRLLSDSESQRGANAGSRRCMNALTPSPKLSASIKSRWRAAS